MNSKAFVNHLLEWNKTIERNMPWENEKDPYLIWLSEILLQQTRVQQGLPYYQRFKETYPTVHDLAKADDDEVFKLWQGLGYYNRCRNLLFSARYISNELNGVFPEKYEAILALKGVGPYTAAAIASFAFELPHAVVDGNVKRVISRYYGIHEPIDDKTGIQAIASIVDEMIQLASPSEFNQAIMNFGAVQCAPRKPECSVCPLQSDCHSYQNDKVDLLPIKKKKIKKRSRYFVYLDIRRDDHRLVQRRESKDIWQNLYQLPMLELDKPFGKTEKIKLTALGVKGLSLMRINLQSCNIYRQTLTHQYINAVFIKPESTRKIEITGTQYLWVSDREFEKLAFPKIIVDYLEKNDKQVRLSF